MAQPFNSIEENAIISAARDGDKEAFGKLVALYEKLVYNTIKLKVTNADDAMDLSQEVFIKLWKSLGKYRGDCRFSTWLYKIATNASLDFLRKAAHDATDSMPSVIDDDGGEKQIELPDDSIAASPERAAETSETVQAVRNAIASLGAEQREVVILRDIEGYSYEEISDMLGLEIGTVKSRLNRARTNLRELLAGYANRV